MKVIFGLLLFVFSTTSYAQLPEGTPPGPYSEWFKDLKSDQGYGCCSISDCHQNVQYRIRGDEYEILVDDKWLSVPKDKILNRHDNPTGGAVACYSNTPVRIIYCFVRPIES